MTSWAPYTHVFLPWLYFIGASVTFVAFIEARAQQQQWGKLFVVMSTLGWPLIWPCFVFRRLIWQSRDSMDIGKVSPLRDFAARTINAFRTVM